jgi:hypothetical protein
MKDVPLALDREELKKLLKEKDGESIFQVFLIIRGSI